MAPDPDKLNQLLEEKQVFFLPYYQEIVSQHPSGIAAADVKRLVAERLLERFGIDISDAAQTGLNTSTGDSKADQWANNLISNRILDDYMLVVRSTRATLYPGAPDNSRVAQPGNSLTDGQVSELDDRAPTVIQTQAGPTYRRSLQLAEYVRELNDRACAVARPTCVVFDARDGRRYVEVHHVIPMAMQRQSTINLDRSENMVPVCSGCHACLHRGQVGLALGILDELLDWFESVHGKSFESANGDLGFDITPAGLLEMYGSNFMPI
jgi:hypothetical protein